MRTTLQKALSEWLLGLAFTVGGRIYGREVVEAYGGLFGAIKREMEVGRRG